MTKVRNSAFDALSDAVQDDMTLAVGGFGLSGIPADLIEAARDSGVKGLTVVSNNMGVDGLGLGVLIVAGQVAKVIASYMGGNKLLAEQYLAGRLEVEFTRYLFSSPLKSKNWGCWPVGLGMIKSPSH